MRQAAVKVLRPELGAVLGVDRFLSEIRVTANLQHSNLLPLFDSGESDGLLYYVMPFVDAESLRQRLDRERQLPVDDAVRIVSAVGGALDYAHRHGAVLRDLTRVPVGTTPHASPDAAGRAMLGQEGLSPRYLDGATGCCSRAWTARRSWPRSIIDPAPNGRVLALQPAELGHGAQRRREPAGRAGPTAARLLQGAFKGSESLIAVSPGIDSTTLTP